MVRIGPNCLDTKIIDMEQKPIKQEEKNVELKNTNTNSECEEDVFKERFKWYKANGHNIPIPEQLEEECECDEILNPLFNIPLSQGNNILLDLDSQCSVLGLKPISSWKISKLKFPEGLIYIKNPFTPEGQRYWISTCLTNYLIPPYITNIINLEKIRPSNSGKRKNSNNNNKLMTSSSKSNPEFYKKLRWVTFGYHHNWDTKIYSENYKCNFPNDLSQLTKYIGYIVGYNDFKAEAAIVNYYNFDSTLSGHQDCSEQNIKAPLFSISFGQIGIFLIGGETKNIKPIAIYIKSGDIIIMTGKSRLSYHGVPKIIKSYEKPWNNTNTIPNNTSLSLIEKSNQFNLKKSKIDVEIVNSKLENNKNYSDISFLSSQESSSSSNISIQGGDDDANNEQVGSNWDTFLEEYASCYRINLNVRQVLTPGHVRI